MANLPAQQIPLKFATGRKTDIRAQFAALCWRVNNDRVEICLVTSRTRGRWILPKGWPMHKQTPAAAAAMEAYEEAGLRGEALDICLGIYSYIETLGQCERAHCGDGLSGACPACAERLARKTPAQAQMVHPEKAAKKLEEPAPEKRS